MFNIEAAIKSKIADQKILKLSNQNFSNGYILLSLLQGIIQINIDGTNRWVIERIDGIAGFDYYILKNLLYWSDVSTGRINIRGLKPGDFQHSEIFIDKSPLKWRPLALGIDFITDKIYVLNWAGKTVHVFDLESKLHTVILDQGLNDPRDIVLDPYESLMFIADDQKVRFLKYLSKKSSSIVCHFNP